MGLTGSSTGAKAMDQGFVIRKKAPDDKVIALAGNPNVGKSTVFNALTGMDQHTGNWPGKTVANAQGYVKSRRNGYVLVDIPGTYSLMAHSAEEEIARDFLCFGSPDAVVVVCDATCLERNLNLVFQTLEITSKVVICVNLMDEAARKHIEIGLETLSERLGVPVIAACARKKKGLKELLDALDRVTADGSDFSEESEKQSQKCNQAVYGCKEVACKGKDVADGCYGCKKVACESENIACGSETTACKGKDVADGCCGCKKVACESENTACGSENAAWKGKDMADECCGCKKVKCESENTACGSENIDCGSETEACKDKDVAYGCCGCKKVECESENTACGSETAACNGKDAADECCGCKKVACESENTACGSETAACVDGTKNTGSDESKTKEDALPVRYSPAIEQAVAMLVPVLNDRLETKLNCRWLALRLLDERLTAPGSGFYTELTSFLGRAPLADPSIEEVVIRARKIVFGQVSEEGGDAGESSDKLNDMLTDSLYHAAERVCAGVVRREGGSYAASDRRMDRILTGKWTAFPCMLLLFAFIFWLTIAGANYPSDLLAGLFGKGQTLLSSLFERLGMPDWLHGLLIQGVYRVLAWVVSVMLPPMAIFFPLFTLLEDAGYLPRIAYDLDRPFKCCRACGKQALTMCMGFGCNAAGVVGCRIISSPRERLIAILTNSFVPCNGRFPMLITVISAFFAVSALSSGAPGGAANTGVMGAIAGAAGMLVPAIILAGFIVLSVLMTLLVSNVLSRTLLKGQASAYTLELPPYRMPNIGRVLVRSLLDRTLYVLGRAVMIAAPCGAVIYLLANVSIAGSSLLVHAAGLLDPVGRVMGLDGAILLAFILGLPANELVVPLLLMIYTAGGSLAEMGSIAETSRILTQNGWTWATAVSFILFALMHWPCGTTLMTIKKETGSLKWTLLSFAIPALAGFALCVLFTAAVRLFG